MSDLLFLISEAFENNILIKLNRVD